MENMYTIGQVSKRTNLTQRALRYYEKNGLITPTRTSSGIRIYTEEDVFKLEQLALYKTIGFPLKEIEKNIKETKSYSLEKSLISQLKEIQIKIDKLNTAFSAIDITIQYLRKGKQLNPGTMIKIIESLPQNDMFFDIDDDSSTDDIPPELLDLEKMMSFLKKWKSTIIEGFLLIDSGYSKNSKEVEELKNKQGEVVKEYFGNITEVPEIIKNMLKESENNLSKEVKDTLNFIG